MKYFFLLGNKVNEESKIFYSVKDYRDRFTMILKYVDEKKIKTISEEEEFKPWEVKEGLHLVKVRDEEKWCVYEVSNTGYLRDYYEAEKIGTIEYQEFEVQDKVSDADVLTNTLKELVIKLNKN